MGACQSENTQDPNDFGKRHDKDLQKGLDEEKNQFAKRHKLLLLGPGNSGKSTFFKQLCTIHGNGLPEQIVRLARHNVYDCCISQAKALIALWDENYQNQLDKRGHGQQHHHNHNNNNNNNMYNQSYNNEYDNKNNSYDNNISSNIEETTDDNDNDTTNTTNNNNNTNPNHPINNRQRKLSRTGKKRDYNNLPDNDEDASIDDRNKNKNNTKTKNGYQQNIRQTSETLDSVGIDVLNNGNGGESRDSQVIAGDNTRDTHDIQTTDDNKTNNNNNRPDNTRATSVNSSGITDDEFDFTINDSDTLKSIDFMERDLVIVSSARFEVNMEIARHIKTIWSHPAMKRTFDDRSNLTVVDSAAYFFDNIDRIARNDYTPTETDVLLVRNASTGIREEHFWIEGNLFYLYDVGGQKSERKKWIQCFDSVDAVLFVASLSCYDQNLYEEHDKNAMHETIRLFDEVVNSRYFRHTSMIIFFNKADLFRERIKRKPLSICFPDYNGEEGNFESGIEYIRMIFGNCNKVPRRELYSHVTTATDKSNVRRVFNDVQHSVVLHALRRNGIL